MLSLEERISISTGLYTEQANQINKLKEELLRLTAANNELARVNQGLVEENTNLKKPKEENPDILKLKEENALLNEQLNEMIAKGYLWEHKLDNGITSFNIDKATFINNSAVSMEVKQSVVPVQPKKDKYIVTNTNTEMVSPENTKLRFDRLFIISEGCMQRAEFMKKAHEVLYGCKAGQDIKIDSHLNSYIELIKKDFAPSIIQIKTKIYGITAKN
jgi:predicted nuclease with TOPRIM domain